MTMVCGGLPLTASAQSKPTTDQVSQNLVASQRRRPAEPRAKVQPQSQQQNEAVVRQVFDELFSQGRYNLIDKIYARDCVVHHNNRVYKLEETVAEGKGWRSAAPNLRMTANQVTSQGDIVTVAWTARGQHTGRGNGLMKPTGKHIQVNGTSRFRVVNGKIVEVWNNYDRNEVFRQLGVSPTMAFLYEETEGLRLAVSRMFSGPVPTPQQ
ncbi:MAG TPA: ester cyclase [Alphaproteobacteria bacterium]|nr:ester cyclase [Alphaproteobacteria bacterium]